MIERLHDGTIMTRYGPADAPALVLIHGLGLNQACWQWTLPALEQDGYRIITYDLYGHGQSAPPPTTPCLRLFRDQLANVLAHCKCKKAALFGFSLGGMIARRFAQDRASQVSALAILFSPHKREQSAQDAVIKRIEQAKKDGPKATIEAALERWFTAPYREANPDQMDLVRTWVKANDPALYHQVYRVLADGIDEIIAPEPPLRCPTLVMTGEEDFGNGPDMSRAIAAEIAGAELHILKGLRHMALVENPEAVNGPLVSFLQNNLTRGAV